MSTTTSAPQFPTDYEALARQRMEPGAFDYYVGGAGDERTLAENSRAFDRVRIRPHVLTDVSRVDIEATLLGQRVSMPILLAPTAYHRLAHPEGEVATARGAGEAGALMVVSTMATRTLEDVAAAATGPLWFQLYVHRDRDITRHLVGRAEAAGYRALVLTVDTPVLGRRERDVRNRFLLPAHMPAANFLAKYPELAHSGGSADRMSVRTRSLAHLDASLTWDVVGWLRSITRLPLVLKGIMRPDDAQRAVAARVDGIIVSNHGGRQLDGAEATLDALPGVVEAVAGAVPVLVDGGVRRGVHVLEALALGARATLIGRPFLWGLAANGADGVRHVLELLKSELELAMALSGCPNLAAIDRSLVRRA